MSYLEVVQLNLAAEELKVRFLTNKIKERGHYLKEQKDLRSYRL